MLEIRSQKTHLEPIRDALDESTNDPPPAYALYESNSTRGVDRQPSTSTHLGPVAGPSSDPLGSHLASSSISTQSHVDESPPLQPSLDRSPSSPRREVPQALTQRLQARKSTSWISHLPFVSTISSKRIRQSLLTMLNDLVIDSRVRAGNEEQKSTHDTLAFMAETCAEHKISMSDVLQEMYIAEHTPLYWAVANYRPELLVALMTYGRPLSVQTISDIRRACLISSNQMLFHALRVRHPPFDRTDGIHVPSPRIASNNLLMGNRPLDDIHIQQASDHHFDISFDIHLWHTRMKAIGQVDMEFIVCGRMWSLTFFSTDPSSPLTASAKPKKGTNTWHVMVSLMEASPPTFFNSQLVVDIQSSTVPEPIQVPRQREARAPKLPTSGDEHKQGRSSGYDCYYHAQKNLQSLHENAFASGSSHANGSSSSPSTYPLQGQSSPPELSSASEPPISIHLECGTRKLGCRAGAGDSMENPTLKPETWSDHSVGHTNAVVAPLGEGLACQLLYDHSPYLLPDGTLKGRLEARLVKAETSKRCIIC